MDSICHLWRSPTPGTLAFSRGEWSRLIGVTVEEFQAALDEFRAFSICTIEQDGKGVVRLSSRRMLRDEQARSNNALYQRRHRSKAKVSEQSGQGKPESHSHSQNHSHSHSQNHSQNHSHETPPSPPHQGGRSVAPPHGGKVSESKLEESVPYEVLIRMWNDLPCVNQFRVEPGKATRRRIKKIWLEHPELSWWADYYGRIAGTPELKGYLDSGWCASLTWALEQKNIEKVLGGHYGEPHPIEQEA